MKLIVINEQISRELKTQFLRNIEIVLLNNKLLKASQIKSFRKLAANNVLQILNRLSDSMKQDLVRVL